MKYLTSQTPSLDLHGEERGFVYALVTDFINDHYKMKSELVRIIHGKSTNILTKEVHEVLKKNKYVTRYKLNGWNIGETIVEIRLKKN